MSTVTIRQTFYVGGVATDAAGFELSNSTGSAGVVRNDTSAVVVAAGATMTKVGTGVYEYSFTAPASGLTYTAYYHIVDTNGNVYYLQDTITDTGTTDVAMPALTGDNLADTLAALQVERLNVARNGPKVSYSVDGQRVDWNQYMKVLDERILAVRLEIAQSAPVEEVGYGV